MEKGKSAKPFQERGKKQEARNVLSWLLHFSRAELFKHLLLATQTIGVSQVNSKRSVVLYRHTVAGLQQAVAGIHLHPRLLRVLPEL